MQRLRTPATGLDGVGPRWIASPSSTVAITSHPRRPTPSRPRPSLVEGGSSWIDPEGVSRPLTWDDVLIVAPYNAQVGAIKRRLATGGAGRHRRQVPGPGGADQPVLHDDLQPRARAARDGLPVQPQPPQRRDLPGALRRRRRRRRRTCCASAPGRPSRCGWRTRSAGSPRWPPPRRCRRANRRTRRWWRS